MSCSQRLDLFWGLFQARRRDYYPRLSFDSHRQREIIKIVGWTGGGRGVELVRVIVVMLDSFIRGGHVVGSATRVG